MKSKVASALIFIAAFSGCVHVAPPGTVTLKEAFFTERDEANNVDSLASWHGPNGEHWLIVTAKEGHALLIYDAFDGSFIKRVGELGPELGQFNRPNGISVVGDKVFVVERDNQRVQVLTLPDFFQLGSFGMDQLLHPYGLFVWPKNEHEMTVYATDNYETEREEKPPLSELNRRVHVYDVTTIEVDSVEAEWLNAFGDTSGPGILNIVESIFGDPAFNHLMVGDEEISSEGQAIKVYSPDGGFTGQILGRGTFINQPEGIALWKTGPKSGYWFFTDQGKRLNLYHVFDRASLEHVGTFQGEVTMNTDGVWLDPTPSERFPGGMFYAIHDDGNASAFSLEDVAEALNLP
ncbi:hypothetical protein F7C95_19460 [Opitutia bacterium ISCC 51]|nr:hypothetical protein F7C95_19460 [Opitutae bacterium ISCC 51]QXD28132.1 hypothetical protein GA003_19365 [Opitutae bacterium ISCC 52]